MSSLQERCASTVAFSALPICRWRNTKAGRVKPQRAYSEQQYYLYGEDGKFIGGLHADVLDDVLEEIELL